MPNFIEIGGGSRKFSKKLVDLTRNDPYVERLQMEYVKKFLFYKFPNDITCPDNATKSGSDRAGRG